MGLYRIIDGIRYDKGLLTLADTLSKRPGDGRISQADAQLLLTEATDGRGITLIEQRTLAYIADTYRMTEQAVNTLKEGLGLKPAAQQIQAVSQHIIVEGYGLAGLKWAFDESEVAQQSALAHNDIPFETALREALRSFLEDGRSVQSPWNMVSLIEDLQAHLFPSDEAFEAAIEERIIHYMNQEGKLALIPQASATDRSEGDEPAPADGESVGDFWVFSLHLPALSSHQYWAVIDRRGIAESYTYGRK